MSTGQNDPFLQRSMPSNVEAEKSVLGAILLDNRVCNQAMEVLRRDDFYLDAHRKIYERMVSLSEQGRPIDYLTLGEELRRGGDFESVGGVTYISSLMDGIPRLENIEQYAKIVKGKAVLRRLISASNEIIATCFEQEEEPDRIIDAAEKAIFNIAEDRMREGFIEVSSVAHKRLEEIEAMAGRAEMITGVPTGFTDLDKMTAGLQRSDLIILAARPSMGKCLAHDSEIVLSDGSVVTIEEVYRRRTASLLTLGDDWRLASVEPSAFVDDGVKPVFRVTTRLGRTIETTITHPFLTVDGWRRLGTLRAGDRVAVPRTIPVFGAEQIDERAVKVLAYLIGDGCLRTGSPEFTNTDERLRDDFAEAVAAFPATEAVLKSNTSGRAPTLVVRAKADEVREGRRAFAATLGGALGSRGRTQESLAVDLGVPKAAVNAWVGGRSVPAADTFRRLCGLMGVAAADLAPRGYEAVAHNAKSAAATWLESLGLLGCDARAKHVPDLVFRLERPLVALFLNRLFATDGWATVLAAGRQAQVGYSTVSERLARQVHHLLLRFGVIAALRERSVKYRGERRVTWQIDVTDARAIERFCREIGIFGKEQQVDAVLAAIAGKRYQTNRDVVPAEIWRRIALARGGESWSSLARRAGIAGYTNVHAGKRCPSRERLERFATALGDEALLDVARSDVYWDEIVSIEYAGAKQVYDLTIPGTHNFVANDVCVHNTSFAMNLAQYAAKAGFVIGLFSLEMSSSQLVSRLLCSEAHVDAHRFRTGYLNREEWARLAEGLHRLSGTRIYIDDTAGITTLEMRAKARRLKQEHGLDLLIVDYLQLIQGRGRNDSRTNEVSQISRDLKMLAKELDVPLIALSQLSRAPETRTDHRPQLSDLRESGCLAGDTLVTLADSGARVPIRDLAGESGFAVWALDEANLKIVRATVSRAFPTGRKPVFRLETRLGRVIRATANHKFRTLGGWKRLDELAVGERLALPREVPGPETSSMTNAEVALLGHLIGDGCTLPRHAIQYTTRERELAERVVDFATAVFGGAIAPRIKRERDWYQVYLPAAFRLTHGRRSLVAEWLDALGVFGLRSHEKRVPDRIFEQSAETIAYFLRHLWVTDGCIRAPRGDAGHPAVYYTSSSERLVRDVQALLLRLGINAVVRPVDQKGRGRTQYTVRVMGQRDILAFVERVGTFGARRQAELAASAEWLEERSAKTNRDVVPREVWDLFAAPALARNGRSVRQMQASMGMSYCGNTLLAQNLSRERLARVEFVVGGDERLKALATSDVYWDSIVSIEPDGEDDVFDLTVPGYHNFLTDVYYVHNSIEQDADVVAFIYREEVYNQTEENQGMAELIIGKQRNGPIGTVNLAFLREFTRFENLWREGF